MALVSLFTGEEAHLGPVLEDFVKWCDNSHLVLNTAKTKQMHIDFRKTHPPPQNTVIKNKPISIVEEYKYIGSVFDDELKWEQHTEHIHKKSQQRLFLRKLASFNVDPPSRNSFGNISLF